MRHASVCPKNTNHCLTGEQSMRIAIFSLFVFIFLLPLTRSPALAKKEACYKVVNGKRYYTCKKRTDNEGTTTKKAVPEVASYRLVRIKNTKQEVVAKDLPVGYGDIPVLEAPAENIKVTQIKEKIKSPSLDPYKNTNENKGFYQRSWVGFILGKSSLVDTGLSSNVNYGLVFGINIAPRWKINFRYSRQSSDVFIDLRSRKPSSSSLLLGSSFNDASITTSLFSSDLQYYFTSKNIRPFVGGGLFYKNSKLEEIERFRGVGMRPSYLSKNSIGINSSSGLSYKLEKQWTLTTSLNFFMPLFKMSTKSYSALRENNKPFTRQAEKMLSSSVFQINLTAEYLF